MQNQSTESDDRGVCLKFYRPNIISYPMTPFRCFVGPRLGLQRGIWRVLLKYSYSSVYVVLNMITILCLQKIRVYFSFVYSLLINVKGIYMQNVALSASAGNYSIGSYKISTLQPLYNTVRYNTVFDMTRFIDRSENCKDYIEK